MLVGKGLLPATKLFLKWLSSHKESGTTAPLGAIPLTKARAVALAFEAASRISGGRPGQMLTADKSFLPSDRQASLGVTRKDGELHPVLLCPVRPSLHRPSPTEIRIVGFAAAEEPGNGDVEHPHWHFHRPGRSVGHKHGTAGSLGLYVKYTDEKANRTVTGFLSAAHVLSNSPLGTGPGDMILSPGRPPAKYADIKYAYGHLYRGRLLTHHTDASASDSIVNECDAAVAGLIDATVPWRNEVPDPNNPQGNLLPVTDVVPKTEITDYVDKQVFLVGRTTPFSVGRLSISDVGTFPVTLPDEKKYLFRDLAMVDRTEGRFSQKGDSGACVYALEGRHCRALGFVVGGNDDHTFFTPAQVCLDALDVELKAWRH